MTCADDGMPTDWNARVWTSKLSGAHYGLETATSPEICRLLLAKLWLRSNYVTRQELRLEQTNFEKTGSLPRQQQQWSYSTTRILEKEANWRPKNDHTHSLIPICTYLYAPWNAGVGRTKKSKEPVQTLSRRPEVRKGRGWLRETNVRLECTFLDFEALWSPLWTGNGNFTGNLQIITREAKASLELTYTTVNPEYITILNFNDLAQNGKF